MRKIDYIGFAFIAALTLATFSNMYRASVENDKINTLIRVQEACSE